MKFYLWIDGKQDGPYEPEHIREMLDGGRVAATTLANPEGDGNAWNPLNSFQDFSHRPTPPAQAPPPPPPPEPKPESKPAPERVLLPDVEDSGVAMAFTVLAVLDFMAAVIGGFAAGEEQPEIGWAFFASGVISGLFLLGFARVVENTSQSAQRLRRIELILLKGFEDIGKGR